MRAGRHRLAATPLAGEAARTTDPFFTALRERPADGCWRRRAEAGRRTARGDGADATVWIGDPTWANHRPIFRAAGVRIREHRFHNPRTRTLDPDAMMVALDGAEPGDAVLLHGCCHDPAGLASGGRSRAERTRTNPEPHRVESGSR